MSLVRLSLVISVSSLLSNLFTVESEKSLSKLIVNSSCPVSQRKEELSVSLHLSKGLGVNEQLCLFHLHACKIHAKIFAISVQTQDENLL